MRILVFKNILFLFFTLILSYQGFSQCSCTNCPQDIQNLSTTNLLVNVSGATNNSLASPGQGVCGIRLRFRHAYLGDLTISLTSPSGQTVTLVGQTGLFGGTDFTTWNVWFRRCATPVTPDPGFSSTWDNNQPWASFSNYNGSYHPNTGCLENFNSGPVNGTWTISAEDNDGQDSGVFREFELVFCDPAGIICGSVAQNCTEQPRILVPAVPLNCDRDTVTLDATISTILPTTIVNWIPSQGGQIVIPGNPNVLKPQVRAPGKYVLEFRSLNGCIAKDSVTLTGNFTKPLLAVLPFDSLTCGVNQVRVEARSNVQNARYLWAPLQNQIISGRKDSSVVIFNQSGNYRLEVKNPFNGCIRDTIIRIKVDSVLPTGKLWVTPFPCDFDTISSKISQLSNFTSFQWIYEAGTLPVLILGDSTVFKNTGIIGVALEQSINKCRDTLRTLVNNRILPNADINIDGKISCKKTTVTASVSFQSNFNYQWTDINNVSILAPIPGIASISNPGVYKVTVSETLTGCTDTSTFQVGIDTISPKLFYKKQDTLSCLILSKTFIPVGSISPSWIIHWTSNSGGNIVSGDQSFNPLIDATGKYKFTVRDTINGCIYSDSISVINLNSRPRVFLTKTGDINCSNSSINIDAGGSSSGIGFQYFWRRNGILLPFSNQILSVSDSGNYSLEILDINTGCRNNGNIRVDKFINIPVFNPSPLDTLTCLRNLVTVNTGCTNCISNSYIWKPVTIGFILGSNTDANVNIGLPGKYRLVVTENFSGCKDSVDFDIVQNVQKPLLDLPPRILIPCNQTSAFAKVNTSIVQNPIFRWVKIFGTGNILGVTNRDTLRVMGEGRFKVYVTNPRTGCLDSAEVEISLPGITPIANAGRDTVLTCSLPQVALGGTNTSSDPEFRFAWRALSGNIVSAINTRTVQVNSSGVYELRVTNSISGCFVSDTVRVSLDTLSPQIVVGKLDTIKCNRPTSIIEITSGILFGFIINWSTTNGNIISGANSSSVVVSRDGIYNLQVVNPTNSCFYSNSFRIVMDTVVPTPRSIFSPAILNCKEKTATFLLPINPSHKVNWFQNPSIPIVSGNPIVIDDYKSIFAIIENPINGCKSNPIIVSIIDTIRPKIEAGPDVFVSCASPIARLRGTNIGGGSLPVFTWTGPRNISKDSIYFETLIPGKYILTATSSNFCLSKDSLEVRGTGDQPIVNILIPEKITCKKDIVTLKATSNKPVAYTWSGPGVLNFANDTARVIAAGIYQVIAEDVNGCRGSNTVQVFDERNSLVANAGQGGSIGCALGTFLLDGSTSSRGSNITYEWYKQGNNFPISRNIQFPVDQSGNYILLVSDSNTGCVASDTVNIFSSGSSPVYQLQIVQPKCTEKTGTINLINISGGMPPYKTTLNGSDWDGNNPSSFSEGEYNFEIIDQNSCITKQKIQLVIPRGPEFDLIGPKELKLFEIGNLEIDLLSSLDSVDNIIWTPIPLGVDCPNCFSAIVDTNIQRNPSTERMEYKVELIDKKGCISSKNIFIFINKSSTVFAPNIFSPNSDGNNDLWQLYPDKSVIRITSLEIFDRWGNNVFRGDSGLPFDRNLAWDGKSQGIDCHQGIYIYKSAVLKLNGEEELLFGEIFLAR
jgi:gliding motility-associated-like protein